MTVLANIAWDVLVQAASDVVLALLRSPWAM